MCRVMEEYAKEYAREYAQEYARDIINEKIKNALDEGITLEKIANIFKVPIEQVLEIQKENASE